MIKDLRVLAVITARGGSKGVVGKNVRPISGKPLIGWTIDAANKSKYIDRLILSSDDDEIMQCARELGCEVPFVRPDHLATDEASSVDVLRHALEEEGEGFDLMVLLQPTSPFRLAKDIDGAIERLIETEARTCITVCKAAKNPHWMFEIEEDGRLEPILKIEPINIAKRRQDLPPVYSVNGAVYVAYVQDILIGGGLIEHGTVAHVMSAKRSLDIDDETDFKIAETLLEENGEA